MKKLPIVITAFTFFACTSEAPKSTTDTSMVRLITLDPGHFHAALVQKTMYPGVDSIVHVYAPAGNDLQYHLDRINGYNSRTDQPTHWKEEVYTGNDYLEKMLADKAGNVVVLAGNNQKKTEYILKSLEAGLNVLADKPMVITAADFETLKKAFETAKTKNLLLYDIMTERFEINTILQRELAMIPGIFGTLEKGTPGNPAIVMKSGHCFYKYVSGNVLTRPAWFMDASQQGEGIVDVTTHLVDLVQWECFPGQVLDYTKDISVDSARRWPTSMTVSQFNTITKMNGFPGYLEKNVVKDSILRVYSNGEIHYRIRGVHAQVQVQWDYTSDAGGDTHYSLLRGTRANLEIRQGKEEGYKPVLYIEPVSNDPGFEKTLTEQFEKIRAKFNGVELYKTAKGWSIKLPENLVEGHEAHFARVTQNYLEYLAKRNMPDWEVPGMLAKYYTTTQALQLSLKNK